MTKRSAYWRPFATRTPLGYSVGGQFNTEPGPGYGTIRFTHVDGQLPKPYLSPGIPEPLLLTNTPSGPRLPVPEGVTEVQVLDRPDGTLIGFYPLFDGTGALVEVVARTRDTAVVADTPWRPLATLVGDIRHAGIEEAVRRQRALFIFDLVGSTNARLVSYPFSVQLLFRCVLRGSNRVLATRGQMRGWANQYGLDLAPPRAEFDATLGEAALAPLVAELLDDMDERNRAASIGQCSSGGLILWISGRSSAIMLERLLRTGDGDARAVDPVEVWQAMARLADQGLPPTVERTAAAIAQGLPVDDSASLGTAITPAWERWLHAYPEAFPTVEHDRIAV